MSTTYVEHANITVKDMNETVNFIKSALPDWDIRGEGNMDWFGKKVRWLHIGNDTSYLALQDGGEGTGLNWKEHQVGTKHIGIVVPSVTAVIERLQKTGYSPDHWGAAHPHRKSVYFIAGDHLQFEFIEYLSELNTERNDYSL